MERFIRYLYEYENGKRIRNVGFVKVEAGNEETTLHMQGKGFYESGDRELVLYLFYEENGKIIGIRQEDIGLKSPVFSYHLTYTMDNVGAPENYPKIKGIRIKTERGRCIAATWDDELVDVEKMEEFVPRMIDLSEVTAPSGQEEEKCEQKVSEMQDTNELDKKLTKIGRQDISRLPRCEWKLANNQFLIHGYNNYHHLLQIEEGNVLKLGVPGIYHIKEAECAKLFGFEEFLSADELGIYPDAGEENSEEQFGYWCRPIRGRQIR